VTIATNPAVAVFEKHARLMGNQFSFSVVGEREEEAFPIIDLAINEVTRIEELLSTFKDKSDTNRINDRAGIEPVKVSRETFDLIERSLRISAITQGAFDITYGSIDKRLWNFDTKMTRLPHPVIAKEMVRLINYKNIVMDKSNETVFLKETGMRIGFGGIGKGYAADCAKRVMVNAGVANGIVNASGDLTVWGEQPDGRPWTIGIADPDRKHMAFANMQLTDVSVATSGSYEKYAVIDGKRYSHTINPRTGLPVHGIKSVTIICKNAELADAMATPVMVMGLKAGTNLINQIHGIECVVVDDMDNIYTSKNIKLSNWAVSK
jgi:FAD:protein FMN transferase